MAIYATVMDVEFEWNRTVADGDAAHVVWLIDKAERIVRRAVPDLAARITAGTTLPQDVKFVVASMVVRVLQNPKGFQAETAGDYSYQMSSGAGRSGMYLSLAEKALLGARKCAQSLQLVDDALEHPLRRPWPWRRDMQWWVAP